MSIGGFSSECGCLMALTEEGDVYNCADWGYKDQSSGYIFNETSSSPFKIESLSGHHIVQLSSGSHILAVTKEGKVFSWGRNDQYQLGRKKIVKRPLEVVLPPGVIITSVSAGNEHSAALSSTGQVYTWGDNFYGQLGHSYEERRIWRPTLVDNINENGDTIVQVLARYSDTLFLTKSGNVFYAGVETPAGSYPQLLPNLSRVSRIIYNSSFTLFETCDGVYKEYDDYGVRSAQKLDLEIKEAVYNKCVSCVKVRRKET